MHIIHEKAVLLGTVHDEEVGVCGGIEDKAQIKHAGIGRRERLTFVRWGEVCKGLIHTNTDGKGTCSKSWDEHKASIDALGVMVGGQSRVIWVGTKHGGLDRARDYVAKKGIMK